MNYLNLLPEPKRLNDTFTIVRTGLPILGMSLNEPLYSYPIYYRTECLGNNKLYWAGCTYEQYLKGNRLN